MRVEIKHKYSGEIIFSHECDTIKKAVEMAIKTGANLSCANLIAADLRGADLRGADLRGADLRGADLRGANLRGADLSCADLIAADLRDANLIAADLREAYLRGAYLRGVNLADGATCDGAFHHLTNVGSGCGILELYSCGDYGWFVKRGCFSGSLSEFVDAVNKTHGDNEHGKKYRAVVSALCGCDVEG